MHNSYNIFWVHLLRQIVWWIVINYIKYESRRQIIDVTIDCLYGIFSEASILSQSDISSKHSIYNTEFLLRNENNIVIIQYVSLFLIQLYYFEYNYVIKTARKLI